MSEQENPVEETTTAAPETASSSRGSSDRADSRSRDNYRGSGRRDDNRGGYNRGGRQGGGRYDRRDDRREISNVFTPGSAPSDYVRPQYRGRSRRVEGSINIKDVHYRNIPLLSKFLDPYGRIMSRRKTRVSAKVQRKAVKAIKQARHLALLPYTGEHMRVARKRRRR